MPGVTLDAGGLIALDRNDRRVVVLLARARETGARVTIPATALAQAIRRLTGKSGSRVWPGSRPPTSSPWTGWMRRMSAGCWQPAGPPI